MYDWRHLLAPICCPNYNIKESQSGFQIGWCDKVQKGAPIYSPNWLLSYWCWIDSKSGFSTIIIYTQFRKTKLVLYSTKKSVLTPSSASIIHSFCTNVYSVSDVIKDAFLIMMCPQFCLPVGFLRVQQGHHCRLVHKFLACRRCPPVWFLHPRHYWHHKLLPWFK